MHSPLYVTDLRIRTFEPSELMAMPDVSALDFTAQFTVWAVRSWVQAFKSKQSFDDVTHNTFARFGLSRSALAIVFSIMALVRQNVFQIIAAGAFLFGGLHTGYLIVMGVLSREPNFEHRMVLLFPIAVALGASAHLRLLDRQHASRTRMRATARLQAAS